MSDYRRSSLVSVILTVGIIAMLVLSGPVSALSISVSTSKSVYSSSDSSAAFSVAINIESGERVPVSNFTLVIDSTNATMNCVFSPNGSAISGCGNLTVTGSAGSDYGYGYGTASGWSSTGGSYSSANRTFGYGYGYGDESLSNEFAYNIIWAFNSSIADGNYTANFIAAVGNITFKAQSATSFVIDRTAPRITSFTLSSNSVYVGGAITSQCSATDTIDSYVSTSVTGIDTSSAGDKIATCTATDDAGNIATAVTSYTVRTAPGGGGASAGSSSNSVSQSKSETSAKAEAVAESVKEAAAKSAKEKASAEEAAVKSEEPTISDTLSQVWAEITAGEETVMEIASLVIPFTEIKFTSETGVQNVAVIVSVGSKPAAAADPGTVYKYIQIDESNVPDSLSNVAIKFTVTRAWLEENKLSASDVRLARWSDGRWNILPTSMAGSNADSFEFSAISPGLSTFAIIAAPVEEVALFDIDLTVIDEVIAPNDKLMATVSLKNLGKAGKVNASLYYTISDSASAVVYEKDESVIVETQYEFIAEFDTAGLPVGDYSISASLSYEGQKEPAHSEDIFSIRAGALGLTGKFIEIAGENGLPIASAIAAIVVLAFVLMVIKKVSREKTRKRKQR